MAQKNEQERLLTISRIDREFWAQDGIVLAGMDEVGRGPLAGPVVVACVVMPPEPLIPYINDSKKVSEKRREMLYEQILHTAVEVQTAWIEPDVIDRINILEATKLAFADAFAKMQTPVTDVMIEYRCAAASAHSRRCALLLHSGRIDRSEGGTGSLHD